MSDTGIDFSGIDTTGVSDPGVSLTDLGLTSQDPLIPLGGTLDSGLSTDPSAPWIIPGLFGTVGESGTGTPDSGSGSMFPSADNMYSAGTNSTASGSDNTVIQYDDGSIFDTSSGTLFDVNGNPVISNGTDDLGFIHFADGTVVDPQTGNRASLGTGDTPTLIPSTRATGAPSGGGGGMGGGSSAPKGSGGGGGGGTPLGIGGAKPGGGGAGQATSLSQTAKGAGNIGSALATLLSGPRQPTPAQAKANNATAAGLPSSLSSSGISVFLVAALVVIFLLVRH